MRNGLATQEEMIEKMRKERIDNEPLRGMEGFIHGSLAAIQASFSGKGQLNKK